MLDRRLHRVGLVGRVFKCVRAVANNWTASFSDNSIRTPLRNVCIWVEIRYRLLVWCNDLLLRKPRLVIKAFVGYGEARKRITFQCADRDLVVINLRRLMEFELGCLGKFTA